MSTPDSAEPQLPERSPGAPAEKTSKAEGGNSSGTSETAADNAQSSKPRAPARPKAPPRDWADLPELRESHLRSLPRRRLALPVILFVATCASTFWVGCANWRPQLVETTGDVQAKVAAYWPQGLTYMGAVLAILLTHEMGHFIQTV